MKLECDSKRELLRLLERLRDKRNQAKRRLSGYEAKIADLNPADTVTYSFLKGSILELEFALQDLEIIELHLSDLEV